MAALTADVQRTEKNGQVVAMPVKASTKIYKGALVKIGADGFLAPQAAEAGAVHAGVAYEAVDNSSGANGDVVCRVERGRVFEMDGAGFTQANLLAPVYASDDNTVSTTQGANEVKVGVIVEVISASKVMVQQDV